MKILNFGSVNIDYVFSVSEIAKPGQTIAATAVEHYPGGKGFNQSLALAKAGAKVYHAGTIGKDGLWLQKMLEETGVDCSYLQMVPDNTGTAFIQIDCRGQNCIVLNSGTNFLNTSDFYDSVLEHFSSGDILLLQNEINDINYLISKGSNKGMTVVLNPSPMNAEIFSCDLSKVNWFIMNEDEGRGLTGEVEPKKILDSMREKFQHASAVLTLGKDGAQVFHGGEYFVQPACAATVVDTTGAGDTFTGFFLAEFTRGKSIPECLAIASQAAAIAISRKGAGTSIPELREVISSLQG